MAIAKPSQTPVGQGADATGSETRHPRTDHVHSSACAKPPVRLGEQADDLMPGQPWSDIRGMGNRLRHAYDRVDVDILWRTATNRVTELAAAARRALAQLEGRQG